jgi:hypothetical protein
MVTLKPKPQFPKRKIEPLAVRRRQRAIEAPQAMKDYLQAQKEAGERMVALRQQRLEREAAIQDDKHQGLSPQEGR